MPRRSRRLTTSKYPDPEPAFDDQLIPESTNGTLTGEPGFEVESYQQEGEPQQQQQQQQRVFSRLKSEREPVTSTRLVRVPVVARRRRTRSTKAVDVVEEHEEEYIEIQEQEAIRRKEIWVKKLVEEKYIKKTPVRKTRRVQRRTSQLVHDEDFEEVSAYRVDEIDEVKERETRSLQRFEVIEQEMPMMQPLPAKFVGVVEHDPEPGSLSARRLGQRAFLPGETADRRSRRLRGLDIEALPVDESFSHVGPVLQLEDSDEEEEGEEEEAETQEGATTSGEEREDAGPPRSAAETRKRRQSWLDRLSLKGKKQQDEADASERKQDQEEEEEEVPAETSGATSEQKKQGWLSWFTPTKSARPHDAQDQEQSADDEADEDAEEEMDEGDEMDVDDEADQDELQQADDEGEEGDEEEEDEADDAASMSDEMEVDEADEVDVEEEDDEGDAEEEEEEDPEAPQSPGPSTFTRFMNLLSPRRKSAAPEDQDEDDQESEQEEEEDAEEESEHEEEEEEEEQGSGNEAQDKGPSFGERAQRVLARLLSPRSAQQVLDDVEREIEAPGSSVRRSARINRTRSALSGDVEPPIRAANFLGAVEEDSEESEQEQEAPVEPEPVPLSADGQVIEKDPENSPEGWVYYPGFEFSDHDITPRVRNTEVENLVSRADLRSAAAFTSTGWLKSQVPPFNTWVSVRKGGVYVREVDNPLSQQQQFPATPEPARSQANTPLRRRSISLIQAVNLKRKLEEAELAAAADSESEQEEQHSDSDQEADADAEEEKDEDEEIEEPLTKRPKFSQLAAQEEMLARPAFVLFYSHFPFELEMPDYQVAGQALMSHHGTDSAAAADQRLTGRKRKSVQPPAETPSSSRHRTLRRSARR